MANPNPTHRSQPHPPARPRCTFPADAAGDDAADRQVHDDQAGGIAQTLGGATPLEHLASTIERQLGYFGADRYVLFYYEPRGHEVVWHDRHSCGFGLGAWLTFLNEIAPLGRQYGVDLGDGDSRASHVLLVDRNRGEAYLAERRSAEQFVKSGGQ